MISFTPFRKIHFTNNLCPCGVRSALNTGVMIVVITKAVKGSHKPDKPVKGNAR